MKRKLFALFLIVSIILCGCSAKPVAGGENNGSTTNSVSTKIETDEKLLSVEIILPASLFEDEDMTNFDANSYANEQGFSSATLNTDGSVTVTMTKAKHKELLKETADSLENVFLGFVNGEGTSYIKDISHNDNFTTVTMKVDKAAYENAFDLTPIAIYLSVSMYQALTEVECHVDVCIVDVDTGETIETITYPDALTG